jgi:tetratricopeptide (TPR) repeat protein
MKKNQYLIYVIVLVAFLGGCASLVEKPPETIAREFFQKGGELEDVGDLNAALKQYKLAMTMNPSSQEAIESRSRVEMKIRKAAKAHYERGLKLEKKGKYGRARQEFLITLRLRPDYPEAINVLTFRKRVQIKRYIVHTIKPGESLSKVAMKYYGDYQKYPIIAKYNNIKNATRIHPGQEIKVPKIVGVEFLVGKETVKTEKQEIPYSGYWEWEEYALEAGGASKPKEQEPEDQIAIYRDHGIDLFGKKQYEEALVAFNQVLKVDPGDKAALKYAHNSHFENAMALFEKEDYLKARDEFQASLRYKNDCQECNEYIKRSEDLYKQMHYKRGIQYFGKEQLNDAIEEWEMVRAIDPNYKQVGYLIEKAETILKNIEKLKESLSEE